VFGLFWNWLRAPALLAGWAVGFCAGTWLIWSDGLKPIHAISFGGTTIAIYTGLLALTANIIVAIVINGFVSARPNVAPSN
jgi:SSS family solute:Na+ symporter